MSLYETIPLYESKQKKILVIGGGGLKGFSALGACAYLFEKKILFNLEILCGTSIGGIICSLIAVGYKPKVIFKLLYNINFNNIVDPDYSKFLFEPDHYGFSSTSNITDIVQICFEKKGFSKDITFKELFEKTGKKLIITGTCVNKYHIEYFSVDTFPNHKIMNALKMTIAIPLVVKPFKQSYLEIKNNNIKIENNKIEDDFENYWVDGGVMDNYPMQLFDDRLNDVIGIYMCDKINERTEINNFDEYLVGLLKCFWKSSNLHKIEHYKKQTILLKCDLKQNMYFDISQEYKLKLYDEGYDHTKQIYA